MNPILKESSTGRDWRRAPDEQRRAFCSVVCPVHLDPDIIYITLEILLRGNSPSLDELNLHALVAIVLSVERDMES